MIVAVKHMRNGAHRDPGVLGNIPNGDEFAAH
jgi:hypothetical protein